MKSAIRYGLALFLGGMLSSCAMKSIAVPEDHWARPFKLTRMQYAIMTHDTQVLQNELHMSSDQGPFLRILSGFNLPVTAPMDVLLFPILTTVAYFEEPRSKDTVQVAKAMESK